MFARPSVCSACKKPAVLRLVQHPRSQQLHASSPFGLPRRKDFFSSNAYLNQKQGKPSDVNSESPPESQKQRRRGSRLPAAPTSLRRVAVEAQRSKDGFVSRAQLREQGLYQTKVQSIAHLHWSDAMLIFASTIVRDSLRRFRAVRYAESENHPSRQRLRA